MNSLTLKAAVARIDITPPVGFRMQGAMRRIEPSVGIESPLLATVLILADEKTKVCKTRNDKCFACRRGVCGVFVPEPDQ